MSFGDKVRHYRKLKKMTQRQLAERIGVSQRTIASYESCGAMARSTTLRRLADALGVSVDYLKRDEITDPSYGKEKTPCIEETRELYGPSVTKEIDALLEQNVAFFASGDLSQETKDAFFEAIMKVYITRKEETKRSFQYAL